MMAFHLTFIHVSSKVCYGFVVAISLKIEIVVKIEWSIFDLTLALPELLVILLFAFNFVFKESEGVIGQVVDSGGFVFLGVVAVEFL